MYGKELLRLLGTSKIVLNSHGDCAEGLAGNIRMFETTAMGALLFTEEFENVAQIFEPGKEIVTYRSPADAVDKIRYYLDHNDEREAIAKAGQQRTLQYYNSRIRAEDALRVFSSLTLH
jgi:spore maturation protein CgeB